MKRSVQRSLAACALVALAAGAPPARAHGPGHDHKHTEPPPGVAIPPGPSLEPSTLKPASGATAAVPTTGVRPLRQLVPDATAVVHGRVARTETFDEDRLRVQRVHVERVLRGRLDAREIGVVEMRGASKRPSLLTDGETVVLLVAPAPTLSYLTEHLGDGTFVVPAGGRDGVIAVGSDAELAAVEQAIADGAAIASLDADDAVAARRRLAFAELAGPSPRLAADAVVELRGLPAPSPLDDAEVATLGRALRETRTPVPTRAALVALLAERNARDALPAIVAAETDTPAMLDAVLAARATLGAPASAAELSALLASTDAGVRAAALRALAATPGDAAMGDLRKAATGDADATVRGAAIDALGSTGRPDALPVLSGTFASHERDLQQRSARAILAIGGTAADDALVELALRGDRPETRTYATVVLLASRGADSAAMRRLVAAKPGPEVLRVIEHGLEIGHKHSHE